MARLKPTLLAVTLLIATCTGLAQTAAPTLSGDQIVDKVAPAMAVVLVGNGTSELAAIATGVVVRPEGILLTTYHSLKNAKDVQVRLKNGEIYDQVQLIGFDERRDVAALRIAATGLTAVAPANSADLNVGDPVYAVFNPAGLPATASAGLLSGKRMAEDVPGASSGYRLLQVTAPLAPGATGGLLVDAQGRAAGIVIAALHTTSGNFAVPLDAVLGLASLPGGVAYASGAALKLPKNEPPLESAPKPVPVPLRPVVVPSTESQQPQVPGLKLNAPDTANSQPVESRDPQNLLRKFRTVYIDSQTQWLKPNVMKSAIYKKKEFGEWGIAVVDEASLADVVLRIHLIGGTEDYTYELQHQNTSIVITSGKVTGFTPILWMSGNAAAPKIADNIVKTLRAAGRVLPSEEKKREEEQKKK